MGAGAFDFDVVLTVLVAFVTVAVAEALLAGTVPLNVFPEFDDDGDGVAVASAWMIGTEMNGPYSDVGSLGMSRRFCAIGNVLHPYSRRAIRPQILRWVSVSASASKNVQVPTIV